MLHTLWKKYHIHLLKGPVLTVFCLEMTLENGHLKTSCISNVPRTEVPKLLHFAPPQDFALIYVPPSGKTHKILHMEHK
jgi:hypothetical protein